MAIDRYDIKSFSLDEVIASDTILFNTNNPGPASDDYYQTLELTQTKNWIDAFHTSYIILNIPRQEICRLITAAQIASHGEYSEAGSNSRLELAESIAEELDDFLLRFADWNKYFTPGNQELGRKYFVRSESASLKYGAGPYTSLEQIIISLTMCIQKHTTHPQDQNIKLYLLPWLEMDPNLIFRVFICSRRITAISQHNIYQPNTLLAKLKLADRYVLITQWIHKIEAFYEHDIKPKITTTDDYTMDIALVGGTGIVPYLIEINTFGNQYSATSALYHWLNDEDILYGRTEKKEFRYTI